MGWVYFLSYLHEKGSKVNTGLTIPRKEVLLMQASIKCLAVRQQGFWCKFAIPTNKKKNMVPES